MIKSNVTEVPVVNSSARGGLVYYCAGRHCAISHDCHRYTSGIGQRNAVYDEYDTLMLSEGSCRFFVNIKEVNRVGE